MTSLTEPHCSTTGLFRGPQGCPGRGLTVFCVGRGLPPAVESGSCLPLADTVPFALFPFRLAGSFWAEAPLLFTVENIKDL